MAYTSANADLLWKLGWEELTNYNYETTITIITDHARTGHGTGQDAQELSDLRCTDY